MFIEIFFKIVLFKGGVLIYAEHCKSEVMNLGKGVQSERWFCKAYTY